MYEAGQVSLPQVNTHSTILQTLCLVVKEGDIECVDLSRPFSVSLSFSRFHCNQ